MTKIFNLHPVYFVQQDLYKKLSKCLKPYLTVIIVAIISLILAKAIEAGSVRFLVPKLPDLFSQGFSKTNNLYMLPWLLLLAAIFRSVFGFSTKFLIGYLTKSISRDLRNRILNHMLLLPIEFFKKHTIGNLISKVNYDVEQLNRALADSLLELLSSIVTIALFLSVMFSLSWYLTCLALIIAPFLSWFLRTINFRIRKYSIELQKSMGDVSHLAHELIEACQIIRIFAASSRESKRINDLVRNNFKQGLKIITATAFSEAIMLLTLCAVLVLLIYVAISQHLAIKTGEFVGLFGAMYSLIRPLKQLSQVNSVIARGLAAAESIFELLALPTEGGVNIKIVTDNSVPVIMAEEEVVPAGSKDCNIQSTAAAKSFTIVLKDVSFGYNKNDKIKLVLSDINITFPAGATTAIVGRSGSGKTSLINLLPRFYQVTTGGIYLNKININQLELATLRSLFSLVTQRTILLNDTIANNIGYSTVTACEQQEIIAAATLANAMEFIQQLPQGLDTNIGSNGNLLSGGQRQRLAIARAIFKNAPILILDEATSALDSQSEQQIKVGLSSLAANKTTIIIAHRMTTIEQADQVIVLEGGRVVGVGKHQELGQNTYYNSLYQSSLQG